MARRRGLSGLGAGLLLVLLGAGVLAAEELNGESYARWRDHLLPRPDEVAYLLDSVRAGTEPYAREAVERARLTATVLAREGDLVSLRFEGATRTAEAGRTEVRDGQEIALHQKRGFEAKLLGRARYSLAEERFVSFELLALGTRWGATVCNMRVGDLDPTPMGVLLTLAGKSAVERLPPTFVSRYGWK